MTHHMKLNAEPFALMQAGKKTIELRLYDEKRRAVSTGDRIIFTNAKCEAETISATVVALHRFSDFGELYAALPLEKCGYTEADIRNASPTDMNAFYPPENQKAYGVLGIEIEIE